MSKKHFSILNSTAKLTISKFQTREKRKFHDTRTFPGLADDSSCQHHLMQSQQCSLKSKTHAEKLKLSVTQKQSNTRTI